MEWISVKDQLPPLNVAVLFYLGEPRYPHLAIDPRMQIGWFYERLIGDWETEEEKKDTIRSTSTYDILFWKYLPEHPQK